MEYDLPHGLHDLAQTTPVGPLPTGDVITRVRRGRTLRTTTIALASAAVVIGAVTLVNAAPWNTAPIPPATPTPTQDPTPDPTPDASPTPAPEETAPAQTPPPLGLSVNGDLVELDPTDGSVVRTIASDPGWVGPLALDRERGTLYVTRHRGWDSDEWPGTVQRVSITDGTIVDIGRGRSPALTRDGRTLAYVSTSATANGDAYVITTLDVDTGESRTIVDSAADTLARAVGPLAWSADGTLIYLQVGWGDAPFSELVLAVDPAADTMVDDAVSALRPSDLAQSWSHPIVLADGRLVVTVTEVGPDHEIGYPESDDVEWETGAADSVDVFAAVVDPTSGEIVERVEIPGVDVDQVVASGPDDRIVVIDTVGPHHVLYLAGPDGAREIGTVEWASDTISDVGIATVAW